MRSTLFPRVTHLETHYAGWMNGGVDVGVNGWKRGGHGERKKKQTGLGVTENIESG